MLYTIQLNNMRSDIFLVVAESVEAAGTKFEERLTYPAFKNVYGITKIRITEMAEAVLQVGTWTQVVGQSFDITSYIYEAHIVDNQITTLRLLSKWTSNGDKEEREAVKSYEMVELIRTKNFSAVNKMVIKW